ncbi:Pectinesterase [Heracleum sosnowskyi]|uniref:Pectinesterase n=1 Tax=Heracleum sosnowskyi TaxID=360622 RepID=A0AAD8MW61_9APIA|nr:Pectinesterase [Heracleum sosnowskyi]
MAKQKIAVISVCSILLLAMVVAVTFNTNNSNNAEDSTSTKTTVGTSTSNKAILDICRPTDYKTTCENSLMSEAANATDPKELIKAAFTVTEKEIRDAITKSTLLQKAEKDPSTADAFEICHEVLGGAIDDLYRSFEKFDISDIEKWDDYAYDLKIWLSGTVAYQETCLEGFQKAASETGDKVKELLKTSRELTVNALAIIDDLTKAYASLTGSNRRLLSSDEMCNVYNRRRLFATDAPAAAPATPAAAPTTSATPSGAPTTSATPSGAPATPTGAPAGAAATPAGAAATPAGTPVEARPMADKSQANVVVAQDGSGKYKTITEALKAMPPGNTKPYIIYVKAGVYQEYLLIDKTMSNLVLLGDGPVETKITGNKSVIHDHLQTYHTSTVGVDAFSFTARDICFENTAGNSGEQAVALRVSSDQAVFHNCHIDGYQDTLYAHAHRQFYRDCTISGTIDFIFGDAAAVFQNCSIVIKKPGPNQACMVTAHGRKFDYEATGYVLQNCNIAADAEAAGGTFKSFLGRPWREYAKTIFMYSKIDSIIQPQGWEPWPPNLFMDTCWYSEYENTGPAAVQASRVTWKGIKHVTKEEAEAFLPGKFLRGDDWIPATGVPYNPGVITSAA